MILRHEPRPSLRPFVKTLWATVESDRPDVSGGNSCRERVLPTGDTYLAIRLSDRPVRVFDGSEPSSGRALREAVVGGARATSWVRDVEGPACSVGVMLRAGAASALFGASAGDLAGRHTALEDLWGRAASRARERLMEIDDPARRLDVLEDVLAARLTGVRGVHPAVAEALSRVATAPSVGDVVKRSGYSHRRFVELFRRDVGLTPKLFGRVLRFQGVLAGLSTGPLASWADRALAAGYSDQSHFNREFREFSGLTPEEYRSIAPERPHHVPLRAVPR